MATLRLKKVSFILKYFFNNHVRYIIALFYFNLFLICIFKSIQGTFHLGVAIGDTYYTSSALQLARPDWSQSFYMPKIGGLIPVEGSTKTAIDCGSSVSC